MLTLEEVKKDFEVDPRIGDLNDFPIDLFFDGKSVSDVSIFKNCFTDANMGNFLSHFHSFCNDLMNLGYPFKSHPIEIRMIATAYRFFAFDGASLYRQSQLFFYNNSHL